jgi:uncharacterized membrane protein YraQ (UPF0718 family)/YHS domain-containing protein
VVIWVLIGWQFTLAEFVGGLLLIFVMTLLLRVFVSPAAEARAREHAQQADSGHQHQSASSTPGIGRRLRSIDAWSDVAHNFRNDWTMLWKEVTLGFLIAGFIGLLGNDFFNGLFIRHAPAGVRLAENAIVGPIVAMLSFVCSVGNAPVAAVLWSGGIGFGGVIAFVFADLIVLPIIQVYRKYYGGAFAMRITALMFVTIVIAALIVDVVFSGLGLVPQVRPTRSEIFGAVKLDYRMVTNGLGVAVFAGLFALTALRGATDPVCGMKVDRSKAIKLELGSRTLHFCSEHCLHRFQAQAGASGGKDLAHRGDR